MGSILRRKTGQLMNECIETESLGMNECIETESVGEGRMGCDM